MSASPDICITYTMTERLYFTDMELLSAEATITNIDEVAGIIYLDRSPFYPRGGGQPGDRGTIQGPNGRMTVTDTLQNRETGEMYHIGTIEGTLAMGDTVQTHVDAEWRSLTTRIHTAGHLIDIALAQLQPNVWESGRGYHYTEGPYVAYLGKSENFPDAAAIEAAVNAIVIQDLRRHVAFEGDYRTIGFGEYHPEGCGGTHVPNTAAVGTITIRGVRLKKGELLIRYEVAR